MPTFRLSRMPDGLGYLYGDYVADDGSRVRLDILPPLTEPRPIGVMKNDAADPTHWIIYANGEEIARVEKSDDLERIVTQRLLTSK